MNCCAANQVQIDFFIPQGYGPAGEYAWMLEQCGLTAPQVTQQILDAVL
ncbi:hypothetical protein ACKTG8_000092 [Cronobacter sakazakii]|uniref:Transketolase n=2 Tax=Cronobacter sakazakii TaxID=28141 RepID=A7MP26_CROS8|nr:MULTISPECIES: hypothetical protein [Cronobacter]MDG6692861.1 hypothetical protein [Staphylococcus aureus]ABU76558.1 hypothetical protein ESA_01296 [Cronobacter sakazakii ATCC BAA-894]EIX1498152.1 hypothetical protein [Cronobacter sakazakii]EIX1612211.1 hypothetical protein [Cronobacter sakazakii]EIX6180659.1 hypothetical protein [Cronobacter sakazakii]